MDNPLLVLPYLVLWSVLMKALLVRAQLVPQACARCGLKTERRELGERVCTCGAESHQHS
jgi:hypothetical protein